MLNPKFSKRISAGTRVYYIDVNTDTKGQEYLTLTEIPVEKSLPDGVKKQKRQRIFIHANNAESVLKVLTEAVNHIKREGKNE